MNFNSAMMGVIIITNLILLVLKSLLEVVCYDKIDNNWLKTMLHLA